MMITRPEGESPDIKTPAATPPATPARTTEVAVQNHQLRYHGVASATGGVGGGSCRRRWPNTLVSSAGVAATEASSSCA